MKIEYNSSIHPLPKGRGLLEHEDKKIKDETISEDISTSLAKNPRTPPEILRELSKLNNSYINKLLAKHPNTPPEILRELSSKKIPQVEKYYTNIHNSIILPTDIDEILEIATHSNISQDIINQLLRLNNLEVNKLLLNNPSVPVNIKQQLRQENYMEKYVDEYVSAVNIINDILKFTDCYYIFSKAS